MLDERPAGLFQHQPAADPVGERYPVPPGDVGMHLLLKRAQLPFLTRDGFRAPYPPADRNG